MKQSELITAVLKGDAMLVVKNARVVNVFTNEILEGDVALSEDTIIGVGKGFAAREEIDAGGAYLCPGFIDAHVHIESSMVIPDSFSRVIMPHGTTTIANNNFEGHICVHFYNTKTHETNRVDEVHQNAVGRAMNYSW